MAMTREVEPRRESSSRAHHAGSRLALLLEEQSAVLELISRSAPLEATLERIAAAVARILDAPLCIIQWAEGEPPTCRRVSAPSVLDEPAGEHRAHHEDTPDGGAETDGNGGGAALGARMQAMLETVARNRDLAISWSTRFPCQAGETPGLVAVLDRAPRPVETECRETIEAMVQLARFAVETERRRLALRSANERFLSLAETVPGVVYQRVVRPDGDIRYTYISTGAKDLFGVSPEEILADPQALFDCHGPEYYATFRDRLLAASRALTMWDVEATIISRSGERKFTHAIARPHKLADGSVVWDGIILDQTRIKEAEMAAAAAEARTRDAIIESIPQGLALYDADDRLTTWNSRFLNLYPGLADLIEPGRSYAEIVQAEIARGIDGSPAPAAADEPQDDTDGDPEARLQERLSLHAMTGHVFERRLPDGRWILINEHRTKDGGTVILHTDVTDLKDREAALEKTNRELQMFASVASHDLQEPLRKIEAFGDRLQQKYTDSLGEDGRLYIDRMQSAAGRMRALINDLLDYSRVTTKGRPFGPVDLGQIVGDVISDLQVTIEASGGHVQATGLPTIDADPTQMRQLFQNLITNALKFAKEGVPPKITISSQIPRPNAVNREEVCVIYVEDNGIGFDMKYRDRIFNIFQRLHGRNEYEGTGIGLATCRKIVERHRGSIGAESTPGDGATFAVTLPVRQAVEG